MNSNRPDSNIPPHLQHQFNGSDHYTTKEKIAAMQRKQAIGNGTITGTNISYTDALHNPQKYFEQERSQDYNHPDNYLIEDLD